MTWYWSKRYEADTVTAVRRALLWLDQLPWWQFAPLYFVIMAAVFALAEYIAAWSAGGTTRGMFGFTRTGHIDIVALAIAAAIFTASQLLGRTWRRRRQARKAAGRSTRPSQT